jgi:hypothetical protein
MGLTRGPDRYSEKTITCTMPHVFPRPEEAAAIDARWGPRGIVAWRVVLFLGALQRFTRALSAYSDEHGIGLAWFRGFEWTPGDDQNGHAHAHFWIFAPFLPQYVLRELWAQSLRRAGLSVPERDGFGLGRGGVCLGVGAPGDAVGWEQWTVDPGGNVVPLPRPGGACEAAPRRKCGGVPRHRKGRRCARARRSCVIFDIRSIRDFLEPFREMQKTRGLPFGGAGRLFSYLDGWNIRSVGEHGTTIDPIVAARLYEALEARRITQSTRGFYDDDPEVFCGRCGASGCFFVLVLDAGDPLFARHETERSERIARRSEARACTVQAALNH